MREGYADSADRSWWKLSSKWRGFDDLMLGLPHDSVFVTPSNLIEESLTRSVIGAFFEVHNNLEFGFLEHLYVLALERELIARGHQVRLLLHLGTKASIHREICHNTRSNQPNPFNPPNPHSLPS